MTFHWRGAPDEDAARARVGALAEEAEAAGLWIHWGRKVLEIRPPVPIDKGQAVRELVVGRAALYAGDDVTDLDGFAALRELVDRGELETAVTVGVRSEEGPREIVEEADLVVDGIEGMQSVLAELDRS
jgi:trehalose 6-phosphate phosphatase